MKTEMQPVQPVPLVIGPTLGYYSDLGSGRLYPERARIEALQYRVRIDAAGDITYEMPPVTMISNYNFVLRKIIAFAMNPEGMGNAAALVDFNLMEQGRGVSVFKRAISFAAALQRPLEWDGVYITIPGTVLECQWAIDTTRWTSLVGASRELGIELLGELIATGKNPNTEVG